MACCADLNGFKSLIFCLMTKKIKATVAVPSIHNAVLPMTVEGLLTVIDVLPRCQPGTAQTERSAHHDKGGKTTDAQSREAEA